MQIDRINLITEMAKKRMKLIDLSAKTKISKTTLCAIKAGKSCAPATAEAIAAALNVELTAILADE